MASYRMPEFPYRRIRKFWNNVEKKTPEQCWEWIGSKDSKGYGKFFLMSEGKHYLMASHRIAYFLETGDDPIGWVVCHKCDVPACCNPAHLFKGTHRDNMQDCRNKGRASRGGSPLSDNDVYMMREMWASGLFTQVEIATLYRVDKVAVCNAINGKTFQLVPQPPGHVKFGGPRYAARKRPHTIDSTLPETR